MANNPNPKYNPSLVIIIRNANGIIFHAQLPLDVIIRLNGKKVISESKILDGVMVFEKICKDPWKIEFEFTVREVQGQTTGQDATENMALRKRTNLPYIFPQDVIENYINTFWKPDAILNIKNSLLNGIGINEIIVDEIPEIITVRGSQNVMFRLSCKENAYDPNDSGTALVAGS